MTLFGWTPEQWAAARARYERISGSTLKDNSAPAVLSIQQWWHMKYRTEPLETKLIGVDVGHEEYVEWAFQLFEEITDASDKARRETKGYSKHEQTLRA